MQSSARAALPAAAARGGGRRGTRATRPAAGAPPPLQRRPAGAERAPLLDAEPVLLVDDGNREVAEIDTLLDQSVRSDQQARARGALAVPLADRARQQADGDAELAAVALERQEMLFRER